MGRVPVDRDVDMAAALYTLRPQVAQRCLLGAACEHAAEFD